MMNSNTEKTTNHELVIVRVFDAPREWLWKAWTDPDMFMKWWGPKGFTSPVAKMDFRVGGKYLYCMRSPEAKEYWSTGVYREIVEPERLVMTDSFADEAGNVIPATHYGLSAEFPMEMTIMVMFEKPEDNKTKMILKHSDIKGVNEKDRKDMQQGWNQSFDKLARLIDG
jgi:uncharacterized protein YndB with AHSA1/START domain